jgi:hypothetical protein
MTGVNPDVLNPNVFYEIGIARGLGRPTILLAESPAHLTAFDTRDLRHLFHGGLLKTLREVLEDALTQVRVDDYCEYEPVIPSG